MFVYNNNQVKTAKTVKYLAPPESESNWNWKLKLKSKGKKMYMYIIYCIIYIVYFQPTTHSVLNNKSELENMMRV